MKTAITTLLIAFALSGCGNKSTDSRDKLPAVSPSAPASMAKQYAPLLQQPEAAKTTFADTSKKIIKTGDISFETKNLYNTRKKIISSLNKLGGYVAEENETNDTYRRGLILKLRVPCRNFDLLLDAVSGNADKIDSKNMRAADVSSQFIDIKTSLKNQTLLEKRYQELLKKSDKMSDVLQIENKLTEIRTSIDSTQGNLDYLSRQVAYSTLEVDFYSQQSPQYSGASWVDRLSSSLGSGWSLMENLFFDCIGIWPLILLAAPAYLLVNKWRRGRKLKLQRP